MLNREKVEVYEDELSDIFVHIAQALILYPLRFEYLTYIKSSIRKPRQIVFEGRIVSEEDYGKWNDRAEIFRAVVTDKRITKQGIQIRIWVGEYFGEDNLFDIFE